MTNFWQLALCLALAGMLPAVAVPLRAQEQQSLDSIRDVVGSSCHDWARSRGYDPVKVDVRSLDARLRLPRCDQALSAFPAQPDRVLGAVSVGVRCAGGNPWTIYVRANVSAQKTVPVLARPLASRSRITAEDLKMVEMSADAALNGVVLDPDQIIGMELTRSLGVDSPVKVSQIRLPKLVKRGQHVTLLSGGGGLEVRMQGKAMADAAAGDLVKAVNLSSGQMVEGVVNPDGTVAVY